MKTKFKKLMVLVIVLVVVLATGAANAKLVAYFEMDGNPNDSIGNNHGILVGTPNWVAGRIGGALLLDGDDYVMLPNESNFDFTDAMTVACWIKVKAFDKDWQAIVTKGDHSWRLARASNLNTLAFHCTGLQSESLMVGSDYSGVEGKVNMDDGQWHHVAAVYNGSMAYLYVDGVIDESLAVSGKINNCDHSVYIGENAEFTERRFKGLIDDVAIFDYALSKDEIVLLYRMGGILFMSEPPLPTLLDIVKEAEAILKEQKPKQAIAFLEKKIAECKQWKQKDPNNIKLAHKALSCDLHFLLAKAKEAAGAPKEEITSAYKHAIESDTLTSSRQGSALLWLFENTNADEHDDIVESVIQNNSHYLKDVAAMAETMMREQKWQPVIRFLEGNLAAYERWQEKYPFYETIAEDTLPGIYFQLAKAKEAVDAPKKDVADAYSNTFKPSTFDYVPERVAALIWLVENQRRSECAKAIKLFTQGSDTRDCFKNVVVQVCKHFESAKDQAKFHWFLDALFTETKYPYDWAVIVGSCFGYRTDPWADAYYTSLDSKPRVKFGKSYVFAKKYLADGKFKEAAELYQDIVNRCGPDDDKRAFEFQLCKCLFDGGQYREAVIKLENFIANNKATNRNLVIEAMLMKGHAHIQLGEIDKAIDVFLTVTTEYPEIKEAPEANFSMGYCYMLQSKFKQAKEALNLVLKDYPESSFANQARLSLNRIESMTD